MHLTRFLSTFELEGQRTLLVNSLSGAVDIVDGSGREAINALRRGDNPAVEANLLSKLVERGYVFEDRADEDASLQVVADRFERVTPKNPPTLILCPTLYCNFRCVYCYEDVRNRKTLSVMTREQVDAIFDQALPEVARRHEGRLPAIQLFGGEPLIPETFTIVEYIIKRSQDLDLHVSATSNGASLADFRSTLERYPGMLKVIQITLDGPRDVHNIRRRYADGRGSFDDVVLGVDTALELGVRVQLRINLDAQNLSSLPELGHFIRDKGWPDNSSFFCDVAPITDHMQTKAVPNYLPEHEIVQRLLPLLEENPFLREIMGFRTFRVLKHLVGVVEQHRDLPCFLATFQYCEANNLEFVTFGPNGFVYPCPECVGDESVAMGRCTPENGLKLDESVMACWKDRSILTLAACRECAIATLCGGGCAYAALRVNGSTSEPVCNGAHKVVEEFVRWEERRALSTTEVT